jgi:quinohemoprotein amine dehydrogenase
MHLRFLRFSALPLLAVGLAFCQETVPLDASSGADPTKETEPGIPVTDKLTIEKCGSCHHQDSYGNLTRISWIRTTPEGWEEAIKRMVELNGVKLEREDALQIVRYLSHDHGLAPEETQPVRWYLEMTLPQTEAIPNETIRHTCAGCHAFARPETWRRSPAEWHLLKNMHVGYFPLSEFINFTSPPARNQVTNPDAPKPKEPAEQAIEYLSKNFDLYSAAWSNWRAQMTDPDLSGRWLITATLPGKGKYFGEMAITRSAAGEFNTQTALVSARDGSKWQLPGKALIYTGYEWRGSAKSDTVGSIRQVMTVSPDQSAIEGRWFWGAYQEFGFTIHAQREGRDMSVLGTDISSVRAGSKAVPVKIFGEHFPTDLKPADINLGAGVAVSKIVSVTPATLNVLADVDSKVIAGMRSVAIRGRVAPNAFSAYDKIDYIKVGAETGLAHTGGTVAKKGFVQYEADAYSNGLDGLPNTADDVNLGPVPVQWSIEEFISHQNDNDKEFVGYIDSNGLFTPSGDGPNPQRRFSADNIGDVWVVAELPNEKKGEPPLQAKSYLVVAVPDFLRFDSPEIASR